MTVRGKRILNYRPLVVFAIALAAGLIVGEALYARPVGIIVVLCIAAFLAVIPFVFIKKIRKFLYIPLALLVGMVGITSSNAVYDSHSIEAYDGDCFATVASEIIVDKGETTFIVSDLWIGGKKLKYDAYVSVPVEIAPDFNAGDIVKISGRVKSYPHERFSFKYASHIADGEGYFVNADAVFKLSDGKPKFPLSFEMKLKRALYENTDEYTASVCQALLLGNKRGFNEGAYDDIAASGLAHVLAVSGLHISVLAAAVFFLLRKLKVNPKISFVIVTAVTFTFSMLCGFSASSVRAVIMCAVLSFSAAFGRKRDGLSSLAFAAILILIFRPTAIMEAGFLLSFYSVFGILAFYKPFERVGLKIVNKISPKRKIGSRFAKSCALSFSTNLVTLPLVAFCFGKVPTLFVLSNFLILPYITAFFIVAMILTLASLITTFGGFIWILRYLLFPFKAFVAAVGFLPFATVPVSASATAVVLCTFIFVWASKFVFANRRAKSVGTLLGVSATAVVCLLTALI